MLTFVADARDGFGAGTGCHSCCCHPASMRPGEVNRWLINYAGWAAPIAPRGLVCDPSISIERVSECPAPTGDNLPPTNEDYLVAVTFNTATSGTNVSDNADDPESQPLQYALVPLYGAKHGSLAFNPDGSYVYTPATGFSGYDSFVFTTSDGVNAPIRNTVRLKVNPASPAPALPDPPVRSAVFIDRSKVGVQPGHIVSLPVSIDPTAKTGEVWRVTIRQQARDCDDTCYAHILCVDLAIGKC